MRKKSIGVKIFTVLCAVISLFCLSCAQDGTEKNEEEVISVTISSATGSYVVTEGDTLQLKATVYPKTIENPEITWSFSPSTCATIDKNGLLTAKKSGSGTVRAKCGKKSNSVSITVKRKEIGTPNNDVVEGATDAVSVGTNGKSFEASSNKASDYTVLVWSDEFEGTSLKSENWKYETGKGDWGWGNAETQNYTNSSENSEVKGGVLRITVKGDGTKDPTSARLITRDNKYFKYGKLEARIKADEGQWSWPAFWMLGQNMSQGVSWPKCGEIDIMEHANRDAFVYTTLHWLSNGQGADYGTKSTVGFNINEWHIYSLEWTQSNISMYVDDVQTFSMTIGDSSNGTDCFNNPFFFILNFAAGGKFVGREWVPASEFNGVEWNMYVDYVRVYQDENHK